MKKLLTAVVIFSSLLLYSCNDSTYIQYDVDDFGKPQLIKIKSPTVEPDSTYIQAEYLGHIKDQPNSKFYKVTLDGTSYYWTPSGSITPVPAKSSKRKR